MATEVKRRRGTTSEHASFTGAVAELTVDLTKDTVVVHDGATQGGFPLLREDFDNVPTTAPFTHITLDTAIFDTTYTETGSETQGTLYWNSDEETLSLVTNGESIELGQKVEVHVKNQTGSQINKGEVVYSSGTVGASGRILVTKMIADGTIAAKRILGVAAENIADGADGKVVKFGKIRQINTSAYSNGDFLWVSTTAAGAFQNTEPVQADGEIALPIAYVVYSSSNNGEIFVRVTPIDENEYQNYDAGLADIAGLTPSDGNFIVGDGTNWVAESGATARASLGAQAQDPQLDDIAGLTPTDGNFIVGNGSNFVAESGNTARTSLGLGTSDDVQFDDLTLTGVLRTNEIDTQSDLVWNTSTEVWNTSDYYISGALNIAGSVYITDELDVAESVSVGTTLDVTGNTTLEGDLTTQSNLQDDGYATGWSGTNWQIQADGSAELQELRVRGALRVFEFIAKQISTIGGSEILSIAQGRVVSVDSDNDTITVENVTGTAGNSFKVNDLFICQVTDINNDLESGGTGSIVKSVRGGVIGVVGNDIEVSITSGNLTDLVTGDLIVAYGNTTDADRQAIMYRNVDRSEDSLIMRMQTDVNAFSDLQNEANTRVAFGDLGPRPSNSTGYSGLTSETFGFFAGDNSAGHILATSSGLFLKDGTSTLAQLTSNTFKVGDSTNFLSFNGTSFDIATTSFSLNTANLDISSANQNIVIGTGSALMTVGRLSSVEQGLQINSTGITNQNYWKLGQGDVQFKVGDGTNFLSFNENAGTFEIETQAFRLDTTASGGGIDIDSTSQTIKLEDSNKVRTQVDITNGSPSVSVDVNQSISAQTITDLSAYETSAGTYYNVDLGDAVEVFVTASLTTLTNADGATFNIALYGGNSSTSATNLLAQKRSQIISSGSTSLYLTAYSYTYDYFKVIIEADIDNPGEAPPTPAVTFTTSTFTVKSYESQTRIALDGVYVNNDSTQYARLTRDSNKLSGLTILENLPTGDPEIVGALYNDNGTIKISAG